MNPFVRCGLLCALGLLVALVALAQGMGMGTHRGGMMGGSGGMMGAPPSLGENPLPATDAVIAKGKALYESNCAVCHGPQGRGDGPGAAGLNPRPPDLRGAAAAWSDGQIAAQIQNGRGAMPPFRTALDEQGLWSIVHYVRRLQGR
jgi:mono/diheme cytochrome c family protein